MTTQFRLRNVGGEIVDANYISAIPIQGTGPTANNQTLVYSTSGSPTGWIFQEVMSATGDQTIGGNKTFTGQTKLGTNGTAINRFSFGTTSTTIAAGLISNTTNNTLTASFSPAFASVPSVVATPILSNVADNGIVVDVQSLTTTGATFMVRNTGPLTVGTIAISWIAVQ